MPVVSPQMKVLFALGLAFLGLNGCGSASGVCHAGCLCYRTPQDCPAGCYPSQTQSVDGSAPQFFCSNGPGLDASSQ
jgi:hypothetical protein